MMIRNMATGEVIRPCSKDETDKYQGLLRAHQTPKVTVDGEACEIVAERVLIADRLLETYGDVQIRLSNGQILKTVRDPKLIRPKYSDTMFEVVPPHLCECKDTGEPHPGRHHPYCANNVRAPASERARPEDYQSLGKEVSFELPRTPDLAAAPRPATPIPRVLEALPTSVPHPSECYCRDYATFNPDQGYQHNTACEYFQDWLAAHPLEHGFMLFDPETNAAIRPATPDEIQRGSMDMAGVVEVTGRKYQVRRVDEAKELDALNEAEPDTNPESVLLNAGDV